MHHLAEHGRLLIFPAGAQADVDGRVKFNIPHARVHCDVGIIDTQHFRLRAVLGHQLQDLAEQAPHAGVGQVGHHDLDLARRRADGRRDGRAGG